MIVKATFHNTTNVYRKLKYDDNKVLMLLLTLKLLLLAFVSDSMCQFEISQKNVNFLVLQ